MTARQFPIIVGLGTTQTPLNSLDAPALTPGAAALEKINASLR